MGRVYGSITYIVNIPFSSRISSPSPTINQGAQAQVAVGDIVPTQKPRIELCLENHAGSSTDGNSENLYAFRSNIHYDRSHNLVDFTLTVVLEISCKQPYICAGRSYEHVTTVQWPESVILCL